MIQSRTVTIELDESLASAVRPIAERREPSRTARDYRYLRDWLIGHGYIVDDEPDEVA